MKAFFFDVDETLLDHATWTIPASAKTAINRLAEQGNLIYLNTGRSGNEMDNVVQLLEGCELEGTIFADGTQTICRWREICNSPMDGAQAAEITAWLERQGINYRWQTAEGLYFHRTPDSETRTLLLHLFGTCPPVRRWQGQSLLRLVLYATTAQLQSLQAWFPKLRIEDQGHMLVNVTAPGAGKAPAMLAEAARRNIPREDIVAFGDGPIDREMLRAAGVGIAMGNADEATRRAADDVTEPPAQDGIFRACVRHGWITGDMI